MSLIMLFFNWMNKRREIYTWNNIKETLKLTWNARMLAKLANTGSVANANVSGHSSTVWTI